MNLLQNVKANLQRVDEKNPVSMLRQDIQGLSKPDMIVLEKELESVIAGKQPSVTFKDMSTKSPKMDSFKVAVNTLRTNQKTALLRIVKLNIKSK